jgi:hypothetical protein
LTHTNKSVEALALNEDPARSKEITSQVRRRSLRNSRI